MRFCSLCRRAAPVGSTICSFDGHKLTEDIAINPGPGTQIGGYRLFDVAAHGSTGTIYRADDSSSGTRVALKVLAPELCATAAIMHRVKRETKNAIKIANRHVARVNDCGDYEGRFFVVREWLDGYPLSVVQKEEGPLSVERAATIVHQVAAALGLVHRVGLVHRDLKPNHIFVAQDQQRNEWMIKLIDIGIVPKLVGVQSTREIFGTPEYLSPEQAEGKLVSFRADLYSLGCVAYEMLTGSPPFQGAVQDLVNLHKTGEITDIVRLRPDVPVLFAQLIMKLLAKQASARPFSAAMIQRDLERAVPACRKPLAPAVTGRGGVAKQPSSPVATPQAPQAGDDFGMAKTLFGGNVGAGRVPQVKRAAVDSGDSTVQGLGPAPGTPPPGARPPTPQPAAAPPPTPAPAAARPPTPQPAAAQPFFAPVPGAAGKSSSKQTILGLPVVSVQQISERQSSLQEAAPQQMAQPTGPATRQSERQSAGMQAHSPSGVPMAAGAPPIPQGMNQQQRASAPAVQAAPPPGSSPQPQTMARTMVVDGSDPAVQQMYSPAQQHQVTSGQFAGDRSSLTDDTASPPTTSELEQEFKRSNNKLILGVVGVVILLAIIAVVVSASFCVCAASPAENSNPAKPEQIVATDGIV